MKILAKEPLKPLPTIAIVVVERFEVKARSVIDLPYAVSSEFCELKVCCKFSVPSHAAITAIDPGISELSLSDRHRNLLWNTTRTSNQICCSQTIAGDAVMLRELTT
jgi:hypothetical protein